MAAATEGTFWDKRYGRNFLKITALLTMLIDHIGCVFLMERGDVIYKAFRAVGRISFPIICFMLVEGFIHTHSRKKYKYITNKCLVQPLKKGYTNTAVRSFPLCRWYSHLLRL